MPSIGRVKKYRSHAYYHIYNRGANKAPVFFEAADYKFFLSLIRRELKRRKIFIKAYCLLPNHFHLLVFQQHEREITKLMRSIGICYSAFLRRKYDHSGQVFQGVYKAVLKTSEQKIRSTESYILSNPLNAGYEFWPYVGRNIYRLALAR